MIKYPIRAHILILYKKKCCHGAGRESNGYACSHITTGHI
jgi:hypothetical protein